MKIGELKQIDHRVFDALELRIMTLKLSDEQIEILLSEKKPLLETDRNRMRIRSKRGHKEQELDICGINGNQFRLIMRQSNFNQLDFSIILAYCPESTNQIFRLRRYNGKSHFHTNIIESQSFYGFHIHMATKRYQDLGAREDSYAEPTKRFSDFHSALNCMLTDCGFDWPVDPQQKLFEENM